MNTKKTNKAKVNYFVDLVIAVGFVIAIVSGIALLVIGPAGYRGGGNVNALPTVLSLTRWTWRSIHDWGSIAMVVGVFVHLLLHWKWIVCMTRNFFAGRSHRSEPAAPAAAPQCHSIES